VTALKTPRKKLLEATENQQTTNIEKHSQIERLLREKPIDPNGTEDDAPMLHRRND